MVGCGGVKVEMEKRTIGGFLVQVLYLTTPVDDTCVMYEVCKGSGSHLV